MSEQLYVSTQNYNLRVGPIPAGTVFTCEQWIKAGGREQDLDVHVARGYVQKTEQAAPPSDVEEEPGGEESTDEVVKDEAQVPTGIWSFSVEELEPLPLEALNAMYKDRAQEFGQKKPRAFKDKQALIAKMTSEA